MIRNNLKIAFRSLFNNKSYNAIHILGLGVGICAVSIIAFWIQNQFRHDNFYRNQEDIYKVWTGHTDDPSAYEVTPYPAAEAIKETYPEVAYAAKMYWAGESLLSYEDQNVKILGNEVDPDFLHIFELPTLLGQSSDALHSENNIVLTESASKSLFGEQNPIGKVVKLDNENLYTVVSVIEDLPTYSDFRFKFLIPMLKEPSNWNTFSYHTFVRLKPDVDVQALNAKLEPLFRKRAPDLKTTYNFLFPLSKQHLYSKVENGKSVGGRIEQVRLVGLLGILVLCIAGINFVNLSTARAQRRAKEVGVRKVVGARKSSLIGQFLTESLLISSIAAIFSLVLTYLLLPVFNRSLGFQLSLLDSGCFIWAVLGGFVLLTGLLAGVYPAFVLSSFAPIKSLKRPTLFRNTNFNLRSILIIFQFGIAIVLIIATLVIKLQIQLGAERDAGYDITQLIEIPLEGKSIEHYDAIRSELLQNGVTESVTRTGTTITGLGGSSYGNFSWAGATEEQTKKTVFNIIRTESDLVKTTGLQLIDGRDIDYNTSAADSSAILLNEAAIAAMGLKDPVGQQFKWGSASYTIVGIVSNYITGSPFAQVPPLLIYASHHMMANMVVRVNNQQSTRQNLTAIESTLKKFNPNYPFSYQFVDDRYAEKFREQEQTASLAMTFSVLAIFVSCLGLFGLVSYIAESRVKEIGIRKVLGASISGIVTMISKDFFHLVIIALLIASPIAWWAINKWLEDFAYRIEIQWWMFAIAGLAALIIALLTVSGQAIRAAIANPVNSLRDE